MYPTIFLCPDFDNGLYQSHELLYQLVYPDGEVLQCDLSHENAGKLLAELHQLALDRVDARLYVVQWRKTHSPHDAVLIAARDARVQGELDREVLAAHNFAAFARFQLARNRYTRTARN